MSNTLSTLDAALKQLYKSKNLGDVCYKRRPMFAWVPKDEEFGGRNMPIPVKYGNGAGGGSATFSTAQTNVSAVLYEDFLLTGVNMYQVAEITGEAIDFSQSDSMAFVKGLKAKVDGAMNALSDQIENYLPRSGSGSLGTIGSISTVTLTLGDTDDIQPFEIGMKLVYSESATDGDSLGSSGASHAISGVNRTDGKLTAATNWTASWSGSPAAGNHIYVAGSAQNGTSNALPVIAGFDRWIQSSGQSSLFGVDTRVDTRLRGLVHSGTTQLVEEAIIDGASLAAGEGGSPDTCFMHPTSYRKLVKEIGSKAQYDKLLASGPKGEIAHIGFRGVVLDGPTGGVTCVAANKVQSARAFILERETWCLYSNGSAVKFVDNDGLKLRAKASSDAFESRLVFRGNLGCNAPGFNCRVTLA